MGLNFLRKEESIGRTRDGQDGPKWKSGSLNHKLNYYI